MICWSKIEQLALMLSPRLLMAEQREGFVEGDGL